MSDSSDLIEIEYPYAGTGSSYIDLTVTVDGLMNDPGDWMGYKRTVGIKIDEGVNSKELPLLVICSAAPAFIETDRIYRKMRYVDLCATKSSIKLYYGESISDISSKLKNGGISFNVNIGADNNDTAEAEG